MKLVYPLFFLALFVSIRSMAQQTSNVRFGKLSVQDFEKTIYSIDSNASAVIIGDIGSTKIVGKKTNFSLEYTVFRRVHILNKNGYEAGNVQVDIYTRGEAEEELTNLKAVTYNLENGKIRETRLDPKSDVFKERLNKNLVRKKFTFPNLKEGSIIEYEYKLKSDFIFNLQPWTFQGEYPCLWSEYTVGMPEFYNYVTLSQGYHPFYIKDQRDKVENFSIEEEADDRGLLGATRNNHLSFTAGVTYFRWVMKDVPALKEESYTSALSNHRSKIEFQLSEIRGPIFVQKSVMNTWEQTTEELLKDEDYGIDLNKENPWVMDAVEDAGRGASNSLDKAAKIYRYVRDNISCTNHFRRTIDKPLKNVLKSRNGNVTEMNLLLTVMLKNAGFTADPVLLSTRGHDFVVATYPMLQRFNYTIVRLMLDGRTYYLDASNPRLGFGKLGYECYNGHARVINREATPIEFVADSLTEAGLTSVYIVNNDKGEITGSLNQTLGYYESVKLRNEVSEKGKDQYITDLGKSFSSDISITDASIDSLTKLEFPVAVHYQFQMKNDDADVIYVNPMFGEGWKENPFKSAERYYPVEMPYAIDQTYILRMEIPKGYMIDEMPKQLRVKLNQADDGAFEYLLSESNGSISFRSRVQLKRAFYSPDEYNVLREFFNMIVKKQNEQIVFKKIK